MNLYQYPKRFYRIQLLMLSILAAVFFWLSRSQILDFYLSDMWFDPVSNTFPLENNFWLEVINHQILKYLVILIAVGLLIYGTYQKNAELIITAILIGLGSATVGLLKSWSAHSCPWDLVRYGGQAIEYPLLSTTSAFPGSGHCFPGGHASGGFSLLAFFFLFFHRSSSRAIFCALGAVILGTIMGYGQVMRGAHFFSHNLWSFWWVWFVQLSIYWLVSTFQYQFMRFNIPLYLRGNKEKNKLERL